MSLIIPEYEYIKQEAAEHRGVNHVIECDSTHDDKLKIFVDGGTNPAVGFYIEEGDGEYGVTSEVVLVNQKVLPELIRLLQSMRKEGK